jgi:polygalacturonase
MWFIHPVLCENITVKNVTTKSIGPNTDGCNPESCKNVLIKGCNFSNGDDCIAIKSGRNNDGRRLAKPSENIIVQDCKMNDGHGGVVMGSEISGGVKNVFVENCVMDSPDLDRAIRLKSNTYRGGTIENVFVRNIKIGEVRETVLKINMKYAPHEGPGGEFLPVIKNIFLENITSKKSEHALVLDGLENSKIENIFIKDCSFDGVENKSILNHVDRLELSNVYINGKLQ